MSVLSALRRRIEPPSRKQREQGWAARIDCYRRALDAGPPKDDPRVVRRTVGSLTWYVPYPEVGLGRLLTRERRPLPSLFEIAQSRRFGATGDTMLDIGANIGTTSIPRLRLGHFRRAFLAEPAELEYQCLVHNVVANGARGRALPDRCALYSTTGAVKLRETTQTGVQRISYKETGRAVPAYTLDDWLDRCGVPPRAVDFVKCDAQGAEGHILRGGERVLATRRAIWQVEYWPRGLAALHTTEAEMQDQLRRWFTHFVVLGRRGDGARALAVHPTADLGAAVEALQLGPRGFTNLLLYPTTRAAIRGSSG